MATKCDVCGRGPKTTYKRSHSNIKTIRKQYLNIHKKNIDGKKFNLCSKCLRTRKKRMAK